MGFTDTWCVHCPKAPQKLLQVHLSWRLTETPLIAGLVRGVRTTGHAVLKQNAEDGLGPTLRSGGNGGLAGNPDR